MEFRYSPEKVGYSAAYGHYIVRCVNCNKDTYILYRPRFTRGISALAEPPEQVLHQYPTSTPSLHTSVAKGVSTAAVEAEKCFSVGACNACAVMTRRAMHAHVTTREGQERTSSRSWQT